MLVNYLQHKTLPPARPYSTHSHVVRGLKVFKRTVDRYNNTVEKLTMFSIRQRFVQRPSKRIASAVVHNVSTLNQIAFQRSRALLILTGEDQAVTLFLLYNLGRETVRLQHVALFARYYTLRYRKLPTFILLRDKRNFDLLPQTFLFFRNEARSVELVQTLHNDNDRCRSGVIKSLLKCVVNPTIRRQTLDVRKRHLRRHRIVENRRITAFTFRARPGTGGNHTPALVVIELCSKVAISTKREPITPERPIPIAH